MMTEKKVGFFRSLFSDERGAISTKRFIAIICVLVLCFLLCYNLWCPDCKSPSEIIIDAINYITCVALGSSTADKFSLRKKDSENPPIE
jgi:tetrahydromethanopterin S-methyltransferase subunit E